MLTIRPPPAARRWGTAARDATNGACRLTAITSSWRCIGMSRSPTKVTAALLTSTSRRPNAATARSTIASTSAASARLVGTAMAAPPAARMRSTVSSSVPGVRCGASAVDRAAQATVAPAWARATATAAPTPRDAPVTTATFPASSNRLIAPHRSRLVSIRRGLRIGTTQDPGARASCVVPSWSFRQDDTGAHGVVAIRARAVTPARERRTSLRWVQVDVPVKSPATRSRREATG